MANNSLTDTRKSAILWTSMQRLEAKLLISSNDQMNQVEKNQVDQRASRYASQYADIIDLPHHVSKRHPQMALSDRAAQFGAYAALRGYDEAVTETVKKSIQQTEAYIEMEQYNDCLLYTSPSPRD